MSDLLERIPPQSMEMERNVIGACLLAKIAIEKALECLQLDDFYREAHRLIYQGVLDLFNRNEPVDFSTVGQWLADHGQLEQVGGTLYLTTLASQVPTHSAIEYYAKIVRGKAVQRALIHAADQIMTNAYLGEADVDTLVRESEAAVMQIADRADADRFSSLKKLGTAVMNAAQRRKEADTLEHDAGFCPTLRPLRKKLMPFLPGSFIVVGGEPSVGKSILAMQMSLEMSEQGAKGLFVSAEMDEDSITRRMVKAYTGINLHDAESVAYRLKHSQEVYAAWEHTATTLGQFPVMIIDTPEISPMEIMAIGRRARRELGGLDFVTVDYLQLLNPDGKYDGEVATTTAISKGLKKVSRQLKTALIVVSSLNQASEQYEGKAPTLRRFRGSGQVKFDADVALLLHRPDREDKTRVECIIDKQRNGPTGKVQLLFNEQHLWFADPEQVEDEQSDTAWKDMGN